MKLRKCIMLWTGLFLLAGWIHAEKISVEKAVGAATNYCGQSGNVSLRSGQGNKLTLAYAAKREGVTLRSSADADAYYYIFNIENNGGFIVISGDDRAYPVLGYSFKGNFDCDNAPPVFMLWLQNYRNQISNAMENGGDLPADPAWEALANGSLLKDISLRSAVGPLGTAEWDQRYPYNLQCPAILSKQAPTGCTATAMAIVMKYHADNGFEAAGTGSHSYSWQGQTLKVDFGTYDWKNMPNTTGA
ncbi:MAG: C10 family peptidase, partial [Tannerella sp.]|nr:C10 family peptidase [Tannerella sp.]